MLSEVLSTSFVHTFIQTVLNKKNNVIVLEGMVNSFYLDTTVSILLIEITYKFKETMLE